MSLLSNEGSATFWRRNSGEISEPPVRRRPSIFSRGTFWFSAFQTLISGCLPKIGRNHFASFRRSHVARLGIGEFATSLLVCKEQSHGFSSGYFGKLARSGGKNSWGEQGARGRSGASRFRQRSSIFPCRRSLVSCCQHYQSGSAPRDFSCSGRGSPSAGRFASRTKPFYQRSRRISFSPRFGF